MRFVLQTIVLVFIAGCGGRQSQPADFNPDPSPFIQRIKERNEAIKSLTAELTVELWKGTDRLRFSQMVAVDSSQRLRIDALSPMGSPISTMVSDGGRLMLYAVSEKRFFIGESSPENLAQLLPVPLDPSELSMLLRGAIPLMDADESLVEWDSDAGQPVLVRVGQTGRQKISFHSTGGQVLQIRRWNGEALSYDVRFARYEGKAPLEVPRRIRLKVPRGKIEVDMTVKNHRLNIDLPLETFQLKPPRGVVVQSF